MNRIYLQDGIEIINGDSLAVMREMPSRSFDAVICDPPYSSGGAFRADRTSSVTSDKYQTTQTKKTYPEFYGDNRDQRGLLAWCSLWMAEAVRLVHPGGHLMAFIDWRNLPTLTDSVQAGGWVWRGIVVWDKTETVRPKRGWFRSQSEYVVVATNGSAGQEQAREVCVYPSGVYREGVRRDKLHMTEKPVGVMKHLMAVLPPRSRILDPFMGSGTTLCAARELGHEAVGIEMSEEYCRIAAQRMDGVARIGKCSDVGSLFA